MFILLPVVAICHSQATPRCSCPIGLDACLSAAAGHTDLPCEAPQIAVCVKETGRAGRDNKVATCIMYYSYGDAQKMRHMLKQSAEENGTSKEQMQHNTDSLNAMVPAP